MKLAAVFPVMNQFPLANLAISYAVQNVQSPGTFQLVVIDNGSDEDFSDSWEPENAPFVKVLGQVFTARHEKSIGVYPVFWDALKYTDADILAFFHSDLIVNEQGWDMRVRAEFERLPKLGLLGFIGSNEIDSAGGRGGGTTSNFQGDTYKSPLVNGEGVMWNGSPASAHGMISEGFSPAAVVDGCAMIFRREVLEKIVQRPEFPPHHFYDRLLSTETRELGYTMGVLGIACDHISGQTVNQEKNYHTMAEEWARAHIPENQFAGNPPDYAWDATIYQEAERQWLREYRDEKHLVPCRV